MFSSAKCVSGSRREWAEAYNGQQGDMWDPHKDMALAD
ncbi:DUF2238 domain-containing protein [Actinosynnema sp. ALI-1.44]|nr:DUF2238 domain-containing protein [Actinosynnema sp. ALI-1.44]